jgi:UTP--glucose-1-phosphate uridylyltransferase
MSKAAQVRKAVIPAAGLGTRFLPVTKAVPKELLPIVDKPIIQLNVEEVVASGLDTIVLVSARGKYAIEDHFDVYPELEEKLVQSRKPDLAECVRATSSLARVLTVRQGVPHGLGHAVLCARPLVGDEPFVVLLGDDLVDHEIPCTKQMLEIFYRYGKSVVALMEVSDEDVSKFGICGGREIGERTIEIDTMVEKPKLADAPSNTAIVGRYILTPRIFEILENTKPGAGGEIQLTDAMSALMKEEGFVGYRFEGARYDAGDKFGYLQANLAYAMKRPELAHKLRAFMRELAQNVQAT